MNLYKRDDHATVNKNGSNFKNETLFLSFTVIITNGWDGKNVKLASSTMFKPVNRQSNSIRESSLFCMAGVGIYWRDMGWVSHIFISYHFIIKVINDFEVESKYYLSAYFVLYIVYKVGYKFRCCWNMNIGENKERKNKQRSKINQCYMSNVIVRVIQNSTTSLLVQRHIVQIKPLIINILKHH